MTPPQPICDWLINENYGALALTYLGRLPLIIDPSLDIAPEEQLSPHWTRFDDSWSLTEDNILYSPTYARAAPVAYTDLGNRAIFAYPYGMVVLLDPSGNFIAGRLNDAN